MDKFKVDDQKIAYFPSRVGKWLTADVNWERLKKIYPIYMEVSPSSGCNHRCIFCALDYMGFKQNFLDYNKYAKFVKMASKKGVKSIMFGGEGEPLLHPQISKMITETKKNRIDVAVTTNGSFMTAEFLDICMERLNWIKISLDAGFAETHTEIHRTNSTDFRKILNNLKYAVQLKKEKRFQCSIGVQVLLLPQNHIEVLSLGKTVKKIGVDYFVVKPYSQGLYSKNKLKIDYSKYDYLKSKVNKLSNDKFSAVFRSRAFNTAIGEEANYERCHATPFFWAYIMTNGSVYSCSAFLGNKKFALGNINKERFDQIWEGNRRKKNWEFVKSMSIEECRRNCRMDKVNTFLDNMKNPLPNHTFI